MYLTGCTGQPQRKGTGMSNVESMVSASHLSAIEKVGVRLENTFTAEEAMRHAHLADWNVRKEQEYVPVNGKFRPVPGRYAMLRDNPQRKGQVDIIGSVGDGYHPIQNEEHAALLDAVVDESGANYELAGSFDRGRRVFISMRLPGHINVGGVDRVESSLIAINSHDGSSKFSLGVLPVRYACANVMNLAFGNRSSMFTVRHTKGAQRAFVGEARRMLDLSFNYLDAFQQEAEELINTTMTMSRFEEIVTREFGPVEDAGAAARTRAEKKVEKLVDLFAEANTQEGIRDTAWAGLNALTEYADHFSPVRGDDREATRATKAIVLPGPKNKALELMLQG